MDYICYSAALVWYDEHRSSIWIMAFFAYNTLCNDCTSDGDVLRFALHTDQYKDKSPDADDPVSAREQNADQRQILLG